MFSITSKFLTLHYMTLHYIYIYIYIHIYIYIYTYIVLLVTRHEETMQTERSSTCEASLIEKLSVEAFVGSQIGPTRAPKSDQGNQIEPAWESRNDQGS